MKTVDLESARALSKKHFLRHVPCWFLDTDQRQIVVYGPQFWSSFISRDFLFAFLICTRFASSRLATTSRHLFYRNLWKLFSIWVFLYNHPQRGALSSACKICAKKLFFSPPLVFGNSYGHSIGMAQSRASRDAMFKRKFRAFWRKNCLSLHLFGGVKSFFFCCRHFLSVFWVLFHAFLMTRNCAHVLFT